MYAVISFCGKQYKIYENQILNIDFLKFNIGDEFEFDKILLLSKDGKLFLGDPYLNCNIKFLVLNHFKGDKINIIKFKRRKHHMKKMGHRQRYTTVKILSISDVLTRNEV